VSEKLGQGKDSLDYFQQGLSIRKRLAMANPNDPEAQSLLASSFSRLAEVHLASSDSLSAIEAYKQQIAVLEGMIEKSISANASPQEKSLLEKKLATARNSIIALGEWDQIMNEPSEKHSQLLSKRAILFEKKKDFKGALQAVREFSKLNSNSSIDLYNGACVFALIAVAPDYESQRTELLQDAMVTLQKAVEANYTNFDHMAKDDDLAPLRDLSEFKALFPPK